MSVWREFIEYLVTSTAMSLCLFVLWALMMSGAVVLRWLIGG